MPTNYNVVSSVVNSDTVGTMRNFAAAAMPAGAVVINQKVTDKIAFCQSCDIDKIAAAGVSGMGPKDGMITNKYGIFASNNYSGKVTDIAGISGFAGNNPRCIARALSGNSICAKCFSFMGARFNNLPAWIKNDTIFSTVKMNIGDIVLDPALVPEMRYSTHGDLINGLHAYNYIVTAAGNPDTQFTLWTKNHKEYTDGLQMFAADYGTSKPQNLRVLYSANRLDQYFTDYQLIALKAHGYDGIFAVYSTWAAQTAAVSMGAYRCVCGTGSCKYRCHFCYNNMAAAGTVWSTNKAVWIAEILDGERHKE